MGELFHSLKIDNQEMAKELMRLEKLNKDLRDKVIKGKNLIME
jgi:hypothetical protein